MESWLTNLIKRTREHNDDRKILQGLLNSEKGLEDSEVKLGELFIGMSETVEKIIEGASTLYATSLSLNDKIHEEELSRIKIYKGFDPDPKISLKILAQAKEVLALLVKDHVRVKYNQLQFSGDLKNSYKYYVRSMETYSKFAGGLDISKDEFYPVVDRIMTNIKDVKTDYDKRIAIARNLASTFTNILNACLKKEDEFKILHKKTYAEMEIQKNDSIKEILRRIIIDLENMISAIEVQKGNISLELEKIGKIIKLEDNVQRYLDENKTLLVKFAKIRQIKLQIKNKTV